MLKGVKDRFIYLIRFAVANESEKIFKEIVENLFELNISPFRQKRFLGAKKQNKRDYNKCLMKFTNYNIQEGKKILKFSKEKHRLPVHE